MSTLKKSTAKTAARGTTTLARHRTARRVAKPAAKAAWFVGKFVVRRKAGKQTRRYREAANWAWSAAVIYVPMVVEVFGERGRAKSPRRLQVFLAGVTAGAGLMYLAGRRASARSDS